MLRRRPCYSCRRLPTLWRAFIILGYLLLSGLLVLMYAFWRMRSAFRRTAVLEGKQPDALSVPSSNDGESREPKAEL